MNTSLHTIIDHPNFLEGHHWQIKTYSAGQTIIKEGDLQDCLFLIIKGSARVIANIKLDDKNTIHPGFSDFKQYDVFGELSFIDNQPHSTSISAITDCKVAEINNDALIHFMEEHPNHGLRFYQELTNTLVSRLRKTNSKAFSLLAWGIKNQGIEEHLK